jgi:hypothetical protein
MPPLILGMTLAAGAALIAARIVRREWRRVNRELDLGRSVPGSSTLRRDPETGDWRPD